MESQRFLEKIRFRPMILNDLSAKFREWFSYFRLREVIGLLYKETFIHMAKDQNPGGTRFFGSRFEYDQNKSDLGVLFKSRLVA